VELRALPRPAVLKRPTSNGREWKEVRGGKGKVKGREGERRWREGFGPPNNFGVAPLTLFCFFSELSKIALKC